MAASDEHAADVAFWREAQTQPGDALAAQLDSTEGPAADGEGRAPRKRRRRRRNGSGGQGDTGAPEPAGE
jgi:poly(A) polymerase